MSDQFLNKIVYPQSQWDENLKDIKSLTQNERVRVFFFKPTLDAVIILIVKIEKKIVMNETFT